MSTTVPSRRRYLARRIAVRRRSRRPREKVWPRYHRHRNQGRPDHALQRPAQLLLRAQMVLEQCPNRLRPVNDLPHP
jgi:hypothetical protein